MAKGQRRGNREAKKPKKEKAALAPAVKGGAWETLERIQAKDGGQKKK